MENTKQALQRIQFDRQHIQRLREIMTNMQPTAAAHVRAEIAELEAAVTRRIHLIKSMENWKYALILMLIYVDGKTLSEAAHAMHYTYKHACKLHTEALRVIGAEIEESG